MSAWPGIIVGGLIGGWWGKVIHFPSARQEARMILARRARVAKRSAAVNAEIERLSGRAP